MKPAALAFVLLAACAAPEGHVHVPAIAAMHGAAAPDTRLAVRFPPELRIHTLANMRDHLATLAQVQEALGRGEYDRAAELAESRLGLSSLEAHGAHQVAPYMPAGMQEAGTAMHKAASRFAIEAANAGATGDAKPALAALAAVTAQCVACHAAYRLE
jgi:cytochrome c556